MKQIIPFTKDISFKTKIGEITGISLENDLILKGEDLITGSFYITGTYKMLKTSSLEEKYSYKVPCDIAISEDYDAYLATIDIDNFTYEIIDDSILRVKIDLLIDNLEKKEIETLEEKRNTIETKENEINKIIISEEKKETPRIIEKEIKTLNETTPISDVFSKIDNNETYKTYSVYIVRSGDTIDKIAKSYKIEIQDIESYNDITNIKEGTKLVIPSSNA